MKLGIGHSRNKKEERKKAHLLESRGPILTILSLQPDRKSGHKPRTQERDTPCILGLTSTGLPSFHGDYFELGFQPPVPVCFSCPTLNTIQKLVSYNLKDLQVHKLLLVANLASEAIRLCVVPLHLLVFSSLSLPNPLKRLLSPFFATAAAACRDCAHTFRPCGRR